jgi:hypothetical protein
MDVAALADLLHETSGRHGSFEAVAPPHDRWNWYAAYMDARERGASRISAAGRAGVDATSRERRRRGHRWNV